MDIIKNILGKKLRKDKCSRNLLLGTAGGYDITTGTPGLRFIDCQNCDKKLITEHGKEVGLCKLCEIQTKN